ncbi:MAG: 2-hydroxyacyl-CoA dehydratase subunit D [Candidatus Kariarchaeaceae archaeon]|jgi:benzoyl-CoA reductase/2-hydroxyglutaryl-CoA dehydratase subunit BcrC/BadD/HgdB
MTILEKHNAAKIFLDDYFHAIAKFKSSFNPLYGYFTNKVPVELLHSLQLTPIRILTAKNVNLKPGASERYIQTFACSWLRHILDLGLVESYEDLAGIIFSTGTCDSLQNFSDIWRKVFPAQLTYNLTFPIINTQAAETYLYHEYLKLIDYIQSVQENSPENLSLKESIIQFNKRRELVIRAFELASRRKLLYKSVADLTYLSDIIPVEIFNQFASDYINSENMVELPSDIDKLPRILISGGMWDNRELFEDSVWDCVVYDDLSFGSRNHNYVLPVNNSLSTYASSQLKRIPEPTAFDDSRRYDHLETLVSDHKIDGVVLLTMKFCDPDTFELVPIRERLKSLDIPFLNLESTSDLSNREQIKTRLTAFMEILA